MRSSCLMPLLFLLGACAHADRTADLRPGLDIADVAMANGSATTALNVAQQVLQTDPQNVKALVREGDADYALGRRDAAATAYDHALSLAPGNPAAALGLGRVRLATDAAAAEMLFAGIVADDPHQAAALTDLGIARDLLGRHHEAQLAYRRALAIEPQRTATSVNLGLSLALDGNTDEALSILRPLAEQPGALPRVRQDLAAALVLSGDTQAAAALLRTDLAPEAVQVAIAGFQSLQPRTR